MMSNFVNCENITSFSRHPSFIFAPIKPLHHFSIKRIYKIDIVVHVNDSMKHVRHHRCYLKYISCVQENIKFRSITCINKGVGGTGCAVDPIAPHAIQLITVWPGTAGQNTGRKQISSLIQVWTIHTPKVIIWYY